VYKRQRWGEAIYLSDALFPPAYWWVTIPLNSFTVGFLNVACLLGPYAFLGGLIGAHQMKTGLIICTLTIAGMLAVGMVAFGFEYNFLDWLVWISLPLALLSNLLGVWVPYLLGFSIKRMLILSLFSQKSR